MRWRYHDPTNLTEARYQQLALAAIDAWWAAFDAESDRLATSIGDETASDAAGFVRRHLGAIDPGLMWALGRATDGTPQLVITPEADHHLRPLVATLFERAPDAPQWQLLPHRPPVGAPAAIALARARTGVDLTAARCGVSLGDHHLINIHVQATEGDPEPVRQAAYDLALGLLGEAAHDRWVGAVTTEGPSATAEVEALPALFGAARDGLLTGLPSAPLHATPPPEHWPLFKGEPAQRRDYPGQSDMFVGTARDAALWRAARSGAPFYAERFSRCGERFLVVKVDGADGLDQMRFSDVSELRGAIDTGLRDVGIGCTIGGATGLRYAYLDLALTDTDAGLEVVQAVLRDGQAPTRSWILFYEAELGAEWVGAYDSSPAPPGFWD